jgi:ubiquinone biosynthesis accessory factor UbiJ
MLTAIENALNRGLPRSPRAQELCAGLAGRKLAIEIPDVTRVLVESTGASLRITRDRPRRGDPRQVDYPTPPDSPPHADKSATADAEIIGGPLGLLALAGDSPQAVLQRRGVDIRGDAALAEKFRELGMLLRPDLEEDLSQLIGDVPAHQIGRFARMAVSWGQRAVSTTAQNFSEYFAHERRDLVSRNEGEQYLRGVDLLREDLDRLEARLAQLTRA